MTQNKLERYVSKLVSDIEDEIRHLPGGYKFWEDLPDIGKKSAKAVKRRWSKAIYKCVMSDVLGEAVTKASVNCKGLPTFESKELFNWCVIWLYGSNEGRFYKEWIKCRGGAVEYDNHKG